MTEFAFSCTAGKPGIRLLSRCPTQWSMGLASEAERDPGAQEHTACAGLQEAFLDISPSPGRMGATWPGNPEGPSRAVLGARSQPSPRPSSRSPSAHCCPGIPVGLAGARSPPNHSWESRLSRGEWARPQPVEKLWILTLACFAECCSPTAVASI